MFQMEQHHKQLTSAGPGEVIGMSIKGINKDEIVETGDVIYIEKEGVLKPTNSFTALVAVQEHPSNLASWDMRQLSFAEPKKLRVK